MAAQELRWLTYLFADLGEPPRSPPNLYVDNKAMLALCREHRLEHRTKHISLCYFLARQLRLAYVASKANTAYIFTKAIPPGDHQRFCTMLACFALLDWSCDLLFSPTLPMGVFLLVPNSFCYFIIPFSFTGWAPPGMKPPSGERARGGAVQGSGAQGDGAHGKADPGMFLMVENVKGSEGDVGSVGKVVMHPLTHWVIDSGCTSHMTPREDLLDEVKPPENIKFVAAASGALLPLTGVGNAKVMGANGGLVGLGNVLLVEGLSANLLSVRWLQNSKAKVTFDPTSYRAKIGKLLLWNLEEKSSCIKDLWLLPIIPWNGKPPAKTAAAATAKATAGGEENAPTDGALDAVKKVQQPQEPHGEVLAGVDATAAWAKASSGSGEADWETWHERLCHVNFPMLHKLVKDGSFKGLEVKGAAK
ncbi:unnamed protein product [Closterium sp. NIES-53]